MKIQNIFKIRWKIFGVVFWHTSRENWMFVQTIEALPSELRLTRAVVILLSSRAPVSWVSLMLMTMQSVLWMTDTASSPVNCCVMLRGEKLKYHLVEIYIRIFFWITKRKMMNKQTRTHTLKSYWNEQNRNYLWIL